MFLLLIPIVLGAVLYKGLKHVVLDPLPAGSAGPFIVGTISSPPSASSRSTCCSATCGGQLPAVRDLCLVIAALIMIAIATGWRSSSF